uniref:Hemagglutinin-like secreted protein n=1 Tax=Ganoderma boninense TaxID=34458 RepID=A0A5K1K4J8_9APHY|nr:Hemagglutinin-like secreted protein [Ganoderma boninense]
MVAVATQLGSRRHVRGRRGGLEGMPRMPLDILFEIFGFLHPRDVLSLARTSKAFRALLMSRDSAPFWKQARRKLKTLPEPPFYLSEPAYANLLFFPNCHICLKPKIQTVVWVFAARFCPACLRSSFITSSAELEHLIRVMKNVDGKPFQMANLVCSEKIIRKHKGKVYESEIEAMGVEWAALKNYEEKEKYILDRRVFVAECKAFSERLAEWKETYDATKISESNDLKEERLRAVKERLYDEGWGYILDNAKWERVVHQQLIDLKAVNKASRLTDKSSCHSP